MVRRSVLVWLVVCASLFSGAGPALAVVGGGPTGTGGSGCAGADLLPEPGNVAAVRVATLCLLNGERANAGLGPLEQNSRLAAAAIAHSQAMVDGRFFGHIGENGTNPFSRIRKTGYLPAGGDFTVGENLAWGTASLSTPRAIVAAWMRSRGHRDNILRPCFKEIGFGIVPGNPRTGDGSGVTVTATFGVIHRSKARNTRSVRSKARLSPSSGR